MKKNYTKLELAAFLTKMRDVKTGAVWPTELSQELELKGYPPKIMTRFIRMKDETQRVYLLELTLEGNLEQFFK